MRQGVNMSKISNNLPYFKERKCGHQLNTKFMKNLFQAINCWFVCCYSILVDCSKHQRKFLHNNWQFIANFSGTKWQGQCQFFYIKVYLHFPIVCHSPLILQGRTHKKYWYTEDSLELEIQKSKQNGSSYAHYSSYTQIYYGTLTPRGLNSILPCAKLELQYILPMQVECAVGQV